MKTKTFARWSAFAILIAVASPLRADAPMKMPMPPTNESEFARAMMGSMAVMDKNMMAARVTGDPDRDFAAMMIPHHQGAVEMAKIQLQYGKDPILRRLAQEIIATQNEEIAVMNRRLAALETTSPRVAPLGMAPLGMAPVASLAPLQPSRFRAATAFIPPIRSPTRFR